MYVCMYVCMYILMYVCMYVCRQSGDECERSADLGRPELCPPAARRRTVYHCQGLLQLHREVPHRVHTYIHTYIYTLRIFLPTEHFYLVLCIYLYCIHMYGMYVRMYVRMYVMYVCMYICMYVCMHRFL